MTDLTAPYDVPLFQADVTAGTARKSDPASSRDAAKATRPQIDQQVIYEALVANGGTGTLDTACAALPHRLRGCVSRRLSDLEQASPPRIRATGRYVIGQYDRPLMVWEVVQ